MIAAVVPAKAETQYAAAYRDHIEDSIRGRLPYRSVARDDGVRDNDRVL